MKIGIVLTNTPAYSETFFNSKIKGLLNNGIEVVLFVAKNDRSFNLCEVRTAPSIYKGNPLKLLLSFLLTYFKLLFSLKKVLKFKTLERAKGITYPQIFKKLYLNAHILTSKNIDWLHFGFATTALEREYLAKAINSKMAVSFRGYDINVYPLKHKNCYSNLWNTVDKVHSISNNLLTKAYDLGLKKTTEVKIINPAVNCNFNFNELDKEGDKLIITTVARLNWIKGIDYAIKAMAILKEQAIEFKYQIIGDEVDVSVERYKHLVYKLKLQNYVSFCGKLSHNDSLAKIKASNIYLQPSIDEGFCNAVLEAQALGVLSVVSDAGGLTENILDKQTGFIVPKANPEAIASRIKEIVSLPIEQQNSIKNMAKERIATKFTISQQIQEFVTFYTLNN